MSSRLKIFLFCILSIAFIGCDKATKEIAKKELKGREAISYFHDTIRLEYAENTGAAMSLGDELPKTVSFLVLGLLPLIFLLLLFIYAIRNAGNMSFMKMFSLALIFSGGIGNIIDRLLSDRHVTDFMNLGINNIRTGIFNVADICITAGAVGLLLFFRDKHTTTPATGSL
ncbi:MAG: signal peptidase II [Ferruginibacter sp.]